MAPSRVHFRCTTTGTPWELSHATGTALKRPQKTPTSFAVLIRSICQTVSEFVPNITDTVWCSTVHPQSVVPLGALPHATAHRRIATIPSEMVLRDFWKIGYKREIYWLSRGKLLKRLD